MEQGVAGESDFAFRRCVIVWVFREQARSYSGLFHFNLTIQASFLQRPVESPFRKNAEMQAYKVRDKLYTITHRCDATQSFHCPDATHTCYHEQEGRLQ